MKAHMTIYKKLLQSYHGLTLMSYVSRAVILFLINKFTSSESLCEEYA